MTKDRRAKQDARAESQRSGVPYVQTRREARDGGSPAGSTTLAASGAGSRAVPADVLETLLDHFNTKAAADLVRWWERTSVMHPGDPVGRVLTWMWTDHRERLTPFLAEYLAMVRRGLADEEIAPTATVEDLARGVRYCLGGLPPDQRDALADHIRREVPALLAAWEGSPEEPA